jgi:hypothetical protein
MKTMSNLQQPANQGSSKWYHQPTMWLFLTLLSSVVIASMVTLWLAISRPDHAVVDDAEYNRIRSELRAQDQSEAGTPASQNDGPGQR